MARAADLTRVIRQATPFGDVETLARLTYFEAPQISAYAWQELLNDVLMALDPKDAQDLLVRMRTSGVGFGTSSGTDEVCVQRGRSAG